MSFFNFETVPTYTGILQYMNVYHSVVLSGAVARGARFYNNFKYGFFFFFWGTLFFWNVAYKNL